MIKPTIGRVVWYQPPKHDGQPDRDQPFAALICYVWEDRLVNLVAFDENGIGFSRRSVQLVQDDDKPNSCGHFATWMPYQIGQAKKHEADPIPAASV